MARKTGEKATRVEVDTLTSSTHTHATNQDLSTDPLPTTKINNSNLAEIKTSLDEVVKKVGLIVYCTRHDKRKKLMKQHLESQSFTPSLLHPTVHLSLGYLSVIMAIGSYAWSMKMGFEESKYITWIGVGGYFSLQGVLWCWKRWVERGEVFSGKRRRMVKRVRCSGRVMSI